MLVLTRKPGEQIVIGDGIRVTVVSVGPGRVKIGIEAPANVRVDRQEIHDKIQHEQAEHSSDVLAAVGRSADAEAVSPTAVIHGSVTSVKLYERPAAEVAEAPTRSQIPVTAGRTFGNRLPNKPR